MVGVTNLRLFPKNVSFLGISLNTLVEKYHSLTLINLEFTDMMNRPEKIYDLRTFLPCLSLAKVTFAHSMAFGLEFCACGNC